MAESTPKAYPTPREYNVRCGSLESDSEVPETWINYEAVRRTNAAQERAAERLEAGHLDPLDVAMRAFHDGVELGIWISRA